MDVSGLAEPGFERLRDAFAHNFTAHGDIGAACCVYLRGRPVVDIWGGIADPVSAAPWRRDTVQLVFSAAKGPTAICIHRLAEQGLLDLDAPVARVCTAEVPIPYPKHLEDAALPQVEGICAAVQRLLKPPSGAKV